MATRQVGKEAATSRGTNPLKWHCSGGKTYLAKTIIELMPEHTHYVEPYFGGGAVLFRKNPEGTSEVVNDINGELMAFWKVIRCPVYTQQLQNALLLTPFSQELFESVEDFANEIEVNYGLPIANAWHTFVKYRMSRQGLGKDFATLSRNRTRRGMNEQVSQWMGAIECLPEACERLRRVVLLSQDAIRTIKQQDGEQTLFYLDPPYLHETRTTIEDYEWEMEVEQHEGLLKTLEKIKGRFILSGYRSNLYDMHMRWNNNWRRVDIEIDNKASSKKTKEKKTECLWMNF